MKNQLSLSLTLLITVSMSLAFTSCVPVFSDLQSARTVGKGQFEVTPYYTNTGTDSESDGASHIGTNLAVGISDKVDLRARLERNWINGTDDSGLTVFGFGPKVSLLENRIAAFLPVGTGLGQDVGSDTWQMQPTMLFTLPFAKEKLEATVAPKYIIPFCEGCEGNFSTNFGLGYSSDFRAWALRAEYGRIFEGDGIGQFSLGFSFNVNSKEK